MLHTLGERRHIGEWYKQDYPVAGDRSLTTTAQSLLVHLPQGPHKNRNTMLVRNYWLVVDGEGVLHVITKVWAGFIFGANYNLSIIMHVSCVYTRVLTWVQLASGCEPSSNPPIDVG